MAESNYAKFQRQKREKAQAKRQSAAKRAAANKIISDLAKEGKKEKESGKGENSPWYQLQKRQQEFREKKYADQRKKESQKDKGAETKKKALDTLSKVGSGPRISATEPGATAAQKAVGNAISDVGRLGKAAALGIKGAMQTAKGKRDAASRPDKKPPGQGGRPRKPQEPIPPKVHPITHYIAK